MRYFALSICTIEASHLGNFLCQPLVLLVQRTNIFSPLIPNGASWLFALDIL